MPTDRPQKRALVIADSAMPTGDSPSPHTLLPEYVLASAALADRCLRPTVLMVHWQGHAISEAAPPASTSH
ncbi:hypothetical protein EVAR_64672_1 [Eumeta japonica]|uniref:Uncharacterized protein n=1 Tax=Eumeta variegata TaxID=151549 RepID=A0A4C1ZSZ8_EUMVA|nr:hypothetical protein EVAR_64672_1 [Eumeta japonica]